MSILNASGGNSFTYADSANIDAFSRLRVSNPTNIFRTQCQYDADPLRLEAGSTGQGATPAHQSSSRRVKLACDVGTGTSYIQSYEYIAYQPSKSQFIAITGLLDTAVDGAVVDVGYGDAANGIFYRQNGTSGLQMVLRSSTSGIAEETVVNQADWNLNTLESGSVVLDEEKVFILIIDLQFLGMGRVRVGFDIDGVIYYVHEFLNANVLTTPYMQTATLPISMVLTSTNTASEKACYFKCAAVNSEGGFEFQSGYRFATPEATVTAGDATRTHILSIRPKTTFKSLTNRSTFVLKDISLIVTGANHVMWELCVGASFSVAPTWASINAQHSAFDYGTAGTLSGVVGPVIASGYLPATNQSKTSSTASTSQAVPITLDRSGAQRALGTLSLLVKGIGGTSATRASFGFEEIR